VTADSHAWAVVQIAELVRQSEDLLLEHGITATYDDVREGAAAALADGILDPTVARMTAGALNVRAGWTALANALLSSLVR
jgi:hypothetical protein